MKNAIIKSVLLLIVLSFCPSILSGQKRYDRQGVVRDQLMNLIHAKFGSDFHYVGYSILDSLITHSMAEDDRIRDTYHTLKGCILFSTWKNHDKYEPDAFIVGMVKNGKIIWDNAPGTHADLGGQLIYAQDINNDGEVDLLISEVDREFSLMKGPSVHYLYVLSWDGKRGKFINTFLEDGKSALIGGDYFFELVDSKKNRIKKITATLPGIEENWNEYKTSTFPQVTYTWNGKHYGLWLDSREKRRSARLTPFLRQGK